MTTRTRKVITAIDANGKPFAEIHRETQIGERWFPDDPVPLELGGADAEAWKTEFNAAQQAENTSLKAEAETLKAEHATAVETLNADHASTVSTLNAQIATLTADLSAMTAERDAAVAQIPPPPAPREVTPQALLMRVMTTSPHAIGKIWSSESEIAGVVAATLFTWPGLINLDSERLKELLGGLTQAGLLTADEVAKILE